MSTINNNIWTVEPYIYKATASGVDIFDFDSMSLINHIPHAGGVTSVWADEVYLYIGTTNSGVYNAPVGLFSSAVYKQYPDLLSNNVLYLHGNDDYLTITTVSGVDSYNTDTNARISTTVSGMTGKCYQTADQTHYFYTNGSDVRFGGLNHSIYNWKYVKHIELDGPIPMEGYQYNITLTQDDIYENSYGYDVRVLQSNGRSAPYIFQNWEPLTDITITVLLDKDVTDVYILYGFEDSVQYEGSPEDIYELYDSFDGDDINHDLWEFETTSTSALYYVQDSYVGIRAADNVGAYLRTKNAYQELCKIEMRFREYIWSSTADDMDFSYGFPGSYYTFIGGGPGSTEGPHSLRGNGLDIDGSGYLQTDWLIGSLSISESQQVSYYNGDTITGNNTVTAGNSYTFRVGLGNTLTLPDIRVAWVRISKFSDLEPAYTEHSAVLVSESDFGARLYAIYSDSSSYIYTSGLDEIIQSSHINDIYVTEGTSQYGNGNVLFLATDFGAVVIEERRGDETNSRFKYYRLDT